MLAALLVQGRVHDASRTTFSWLAGLWRSRADLGIELHDGATADHVSSHLLRDNHDVLRRLLFQYPRLGAHHGRNRRPRDELGNDLFAGGCPELGKGCMGNRVMKMDRDRRSEAGLKSEGVCVNAAGDNKPATGEPWPMG